MFDNQSVETADNLSTKAGLVISDRVPSVLTIGIVAPSLDILGGQGVQAASLAAAMQRDGFDVREIPVNPKFPFGLEWLRRVPVARTIFNQLLYIPGLIRLRHVDVVHVFSASYWSFLLAPMPAMLAAKLLRKPVILNYHSGEAQDHLSNWNIGVHPWLRMADRIAVPSNYLKQVFAGYGYETDVIRNIVDLDHFRFRERKPFGPRLLSVRNLEPYYQVGNTLKAFALIRQRYKNATLTVAGYGSEEQELRRWVASRGLQGVRFVGRTEPEDMPALYDSADIFINSSVVDNQPLSILEAFASGLNVISTPPGDIPAMISDKQTGLIVPPDMPRAIADAVAGLLEDPEEARRMAVRASKEVKKYTWSRVSGQWAKLYRETAA